MDESINVPVEIWDFFDPVWQYNTLRLAFSAEFAEIIWQPSFVVDCQSVVFILFVCKILYK